MQLSVYDNKTNVSIIYIQLDHPATLVWSIIMHALFGRTFADINTKDLPLTSMLTRQNISLSLFGAHQNLSNMTSYKPLGTCTMHAESLLPM